MSEDTIWNRVVNFEDAIEKRDEIGHPGMSTHSYVAGPDRGTRWLLLTLNVIAAGGGIEPHYHQDLVADHAYFLISGTATARIGDEEFEVRPNGLMVFRADVVHGFKITSPEGANVLRLGASPDGTARGRSVFV